LKLESDDEDENTAGVSR